MICLHPGASADRLDCARNRRSAPIWCVAGSDHQPRLWVPLPRVCKFNRRWQLAAEFSTVSDIGMSDAGRFPVGGRAASEGAKDQVDGAVDFSGLCRVEAACEVSEAAGVHGSHLVD